MDSQKAVGFTRDLGKPPGWDDSKLRCGSLPITDRLINGVPAMTSVWIPTQYELEFLNAGGQIHLTIIGEVHPPVMLQVLVSDLVKD